VESTREPRQREARKRFESSQRTRFHRTRGRGEHEEFRSNGARASISGIKIRGGGRMMAPNWKHSERKTTRNMTHMTPKIHQLRYIYPYVGHKYNHIGDTLLKGIQEKVEQ